MTAANPAGASVDPAEIGRFADHADRWWAPRGPFSGLHRLNRARLGFIRDTALKRFGRPPGDRRPFVGLRLLDVGCGGGLVCEPMARLGFTVTGVDADAAGLAAARVHAEAADLPIAYRHGAAEDLAAEGERWDVVLALEIVEHVADPGAFLANCVALAAPGGLLVVSTISRTARSLALAKIAAEHLLRWAPPGTHDWRRLLTPAELTALAASAASVFAGPVGLSFDLARLDWRRSRDTSMNYIQAFGIDPPVIGVAFAPQAVENKASAGAINAASR